MYRGGRRQVNSCEDVKHRVYSCIIFYSCIIYFYLSYYYCCYFVSLVPIYLLGNDGW